MSNKNPCNSKNECECKWHASELARRMNACDVIEKPMTTPFVLVVSATMVVIAGCCVRSSPCGKGPKKTTVEILMSLEAAVVQYHEAHGEYPAGITEMVTAYIHMSKKEPDAWQDISGYISKKGDIEYRVLDGYGNEIIYRNNPTYPILSGANYDLYSAGPNGIDEHGWGDDIMSYDYSASLSRYWQIRYEKRK